MRSAGTTAGSKLGVLCFAELLSAQPESFGQLETCQRNPGLHQWAFDVDSDEASEPHFIIWNPDLRPLAATRCWLHVQVQQ